MTVGNIFSDRQRMFVLKSLLSLVNNTVFVISVFAVYDIRYHLLDHPITVIPCNYSTLLRVHRSRTRVVPSRPATSAETRQPAAGRADSFPISAWYASFEGGLR